jgi:hypothetical protein
MTENLVSRKPSGQSEKIRAAHDCGREAGQGVAATPRRRKVLATPSSPVVAHVYQGDGGDVFTL